MRFPSCRRAGQGCSLYAMSSSSALVSAFVLAFRRASRSVLAAASISSWVAALLQGVSVACIQLVCQSFYRGSHIVADIGDHLAHELDLMFERARIQLNGFQICDRTCQIRDRCRHFRSRRIIICRYALRCRDRRLQCTVGQIGVAICADCFCRFDQRVQFGLGYDQPQLLGFFRSRS